MSDVMKAEFLRDVTFTDARGLRYAELALVNEEGLTIYNSTGLSEAPPDQWDALDIDEVKERFQLQAAVKNGPHWWLADTETFQFGQELQVGGMRFRWAATLPPALAAGGGLEAQFYSVFEANKRGTMVYSKGKPVYELVSPDGEAFVLQSSNLEPTEAFVNLGDRLQLPQGWGFRARTLQKDLTLELDGKVKVVLDDLKNVYNLAPAVG